MRRFWLVLLLAIAHLPAAPAAAEEARARVRESRQAMESGDDGSELFLARSSAGAELVTEDTRTRDPNLRGFGGKAAVTRAVAVRVDETSVASLQPAVVPPAPAHAERLPYYPTAPPSRS